MSHEQRRQQPAVVLRVVAAQAGIHHRVASACFLPPGTHCACGGILARCGRLVLIWILQSLVACEAGGVCTMCALRCMLIVVYWCGAPLLFVCVGMVHKPCSVCTATVCCSCWHRKNITAAWQSCVRVRRSHHVCESAEPCGHICFVSNGGGATY